MNDVVIKNVSALEVLDSRGNPTVEAYVKLSNGAIGSAMVPSGASTGSEEAVELRDNDKTRFCGKGVLKAVNNINNEISDTLVDASPFNQRNIDKILIEMDSTEDKHRIGANATLAVSLAVAKAASASLNIPLYRYLGGVNASTLPLPMMNIVNGGKHASNGLAIQEFMIMPISAENFPEAVRMGAEIFHSLKKLLAKENLETSVGDEGGFAPNFKTSYQALDYISKAVENTRYKLGEDVVLALDAAATEFADGKKYQIDDKTIDTEGLIKYYQDLIEKYPIYSIEDPFSESDHAGFKQLTALFGKKIQIVGDDLFCTNLNLIKEGIKNNLANAVLIKPNQIGTLTETLDAIELARKNSYNTIISHRSGETEDVSIAHIAVAVNAGQIKTGSLSRTDRVCKYNELLRISNDMQSYYYYGEDFIKKFTKQ